ncbi:peptidylprolyl isomerase [Heliophilum fasciatum]|uniref:Peptidyl-prolyl cis-trans isomerase n=1 Tax=Heliophilum fasciatum TaxID=35700 RepID=A0A4R2RMH4_9FIRM|nr:peptidylprolyl isomerase [Heliophilum fasciatum]MCW2277517.1 peptidylprolyl isomerase [Heliophilum fasciatum]TCP65192.1 peptidylprolyl isomerase [Heliophilum fasciatum]
MTNERKQYSAPPAMVIDPQKSYKATFTTTMGNFQIELLPANAPNTVNNFVFLARDHFYDGVVFHRIIKDFMIQTGCPQGTGTGGPGYRFADELPPQLPYEAGIVAMANAGPNTNGSQFFICNGKSARNLNSYPNYTVFGRVVDGMDVVLAISAVPVGRSPHGEMSRPLEPVTIEKVTIEEA